MAISFLVLFGSQARGDADGASDTDLLLATEEPGIRHVSEGKLSLSFYGLANLRERAAHGDLFVCHVVSEGRLLAGDAEQFDELRRAFRLRSDYGDEVAKASDLGRFLIRHGAGLRNDQLVNRRLAWVARTILIARSAETGHPVFSPKALAGWAHAPEVEALVSSRYSTERVTKSLRTLGEVIEQWGERAPAPEPRSVSSYRERFTLTDNAVALQTLAWRTGAKGSNDYPG